MVKQYIAAFGAASDGAYGFVAPGSSADRFTRVTIALTRFHGDTAIPLLEVPQGYKMANGSILAEFEVDATGKIASLTRGGQNMDTLLAAGDGKTYASSDNSFQVSVLAWQAGDINGRGNTAVLFTLSNHGTAPANFAIDAYCLSGKAYPFTDDNDDIAPGTEVVYPYALGPVPRGGTLHLTLTTTVGNTEVDTSMPVF